jgi:hypothetical protein
MNNLAVSRGIAEGIYVRFILFTGSTKRHINQGFRQRHPADLSVKSEGATMRRSKCDVNQVFRPLIVGGKVAIDH